MSPTITWHLLDVKGKSVHTSPAFQAFGLKWYLKFYPHGYDRDNYGYVAVALVLEDMGNEDSVFVQGDIYLSSPSVAQGRKILELRRPSDDGWVQFSSTRLSYGQKRCMTSAELQDTYLSTEDDLHIELDGFTIHRPVYQLVNARMFATTLPKFVTLVRGKFVPHNGPQELATECEAPSQTIVGNHERDEISPFKSSPYPGRSMMFRSGDGIEMDDSHRSIINNTAASRVVATNNYRGLDSSGYISSTQQQHVGELSDDEVEELRTLERLKGASIRAAHDTRLATPTRLTHVLAGSATTASYNNSNNNNNNIGTNGNTTYFK